MVMIDNKDSAAYKIAKKEALEQLENTLSKMKGAKIDEIIEHWISFTKLDFFNFSHVIDPNKIYVK